MAHFTPHAWALMIDAQKETQKLDALTRGLAATMGVDAARAFVEARTENGKFTASGVDAVKAVSALAVASDGVSKSIGAAFQRTTAQKIDNLQGSVESLAITLIDRLAPNINATVDGLTDFVTKVTDVAEANPTLTKTSLAFLAITAAIGPTLFLGGKFVGMIQTTAGAVSATRRGLETAATWLELYGEQAQKSGKRVRGGFLNSLSGVTSMLGGPWGLAVGLGITVLGGFVLKQHEAKKATQAFTDSLTFQNGELDDNSRSTLANQLAKDGVLEASTKAGVSEKDFTDALLEGGQARESMITQLEGIAREHTRTVQTGTSTTRVLDSTGEAAAKAAARKTFRNPCITARGASAS